MKTKLMLIGLFLLIISCNAKQQDDRAKSDTVETSQISSDSSAIDDTLEAIWEYDYNNKTEEFELKQLRQVDSDAVTGVDIEKIINRTFPKVQIKFIRTSNDSAFISIPDSKVLTQQMGSAGAESFMTTTTFSFTELKGIKHVSFDFEEGDHAMPGIYNRNSWDINKTK